MFFYFSFLCNSLFYMYPMYDFYNNTSNIIMEWFGLFMVTHSRSLSDITRQLTYNFLLAFHSNQFPAVCLASFQRYKIIHLSKISNLSSIPTFIAPSREWPRWNFSQYLMVWENFPGYYTAWWLVQSVLTHYQHVTDKLTDRLIELRFHFSPDTK